MRRSFAPLILLIFNGLNCSSEAAVQLRARWDLAVGGSRTTLNQDGYSDWNSLDEIFVLGGVQQTIHWRKLLFEVRPELRYLHSNAYRSEKSDLAYPCLEIPGRRIDFSRTVHSSNTSETLLDVETLYFKIQTEKVEALAGRQNLNIGIIKNFPIWNKFASFNLINTRLQLQPGVDQINARIQGERWWLQGLGVYSDDAKQNAHLVLIEFPLEILEFQMLAGDWWQNKAAGFNLQKDFGGVLLKIEWLWTGIDPNDTDKHSQGVMAAEYAFNEEWATTIEYIYFGKGSTIEGDLTLEPPSQFFPLRFAYYLLWQLEWQATPYWNLSMIPLVNLVDRSTLMTLNIRKNISDNIDLNFQYKVPLGSPETELSSRAFEFPDETYIGVDQTALLQIKMFF